jgi:hypothetical protein
MVGDVVMQGLVVLESLQLVPVLPKLRNAIFGLELSVCSKLSSFDNIDMVKLGRIKIVPYGEANPASKLPSDASLMVWSDDTGLFYEGRNDN